MHSAASQPFGNDVPFQVLIRTGLLFGKTGPSSKTVCYLQSLEKANSEFSK